MKKLNLKFLMCFVSIVATISGCTAPNGTDGVMLSDVPKEEIMGTRVVTRQGGDYTEIKWCAKDDPESCKMRFFDSSGKEVLESDLPPIVVGDNRGVTPELKEQIDAFPEDARGEGLRVRILFYDRVAPFEELSLTVGGVSGEPKYYLNGKEIDEAKYKQIKKQQAKAQEEYWEKQKKDFKEQLDKLLQKEKAVISLTQEEYDRAVEKSVLEVEIVIREITPLFERNKDIIEYITPTFEATEDSLESAMIATGVTTTLASNSSYFGTGISALMVEPICHINPDDYRYKSMGRTACMALHSTNVSKIIQTVSPEVFVYCYGGVPELRDLEKVLKSSANGVPIQVLNMSMAISTRGQIGRYYIQDRDYDNFVYKNNKLLIKSAGNRGVGDGYVTSPGHGLNVLTVGNYNDATGRINIGSSYKGAIGMGTMKPELSAPGTFINAGFAYNPETLTPEEIEMTGTSQAAPHVTGIAADLLSAYPHWFEGSPAILKATLMAMALDPIADANEVVNGVSYPRGAVGLGGIDLEQFRKNFYAFKWWNIPNDSWAQYDRLDDVPGNGTLDRVLYLNKGMNIRAVVVWLNRGDWTYNSLATGYKIGMDIDLKVYNPQNDVFVSSMSLPNSFEKVDFTVPESGNYRFSLNRFSNSDTSSRVKMGLAVLAHD